MNRSRSFLPLTLLVFTLLLVVLLACAPGTQPQPGGVALTRIATGATQSQTVEMPPAVPEQRLLTLDFPSAIRAGDSDVVRLTLELGGDGSLTPTVSIVGKPTQGQGLSIPNVYDTHNVLAEARLDMAGVDIRPGATISETLLPGQKVTFYWSVLPAEVGKYKGTVWFFLRFIPKDGGVESRQALSAQLIEIESTSFFGIKAGLARWLGMAGTFLSAVLGLPFLEQVLRWLWRRIPARK